MFSSTARAQFELACVWLAKQPRLDRVTRRCAHVYGLKCICERQAGYVSNGAMAAALISCGFKLPRKPGWPSAFVNIPDYVRGTIGPPDFGANDLARYLAAHLQLPEAA